MQRRRFLQLAGGVVATAGLTAIAGTTTNASTPGDAGDARDFLAARRHLRTRFGDIAYVSRGDGPAALFLHGFPLSSFQWRGAIARLSPYRRCIAPDFLALGETRVAPGQDVGPDAQVDMLVELLDRLRVPHVDVVANDSGGAVAQLLVARHRHRVRTLLLTNCDTEIDCPPAALLPVIDLAKQGKFAERWLAPWHANHALARSPEGIGGMCYADPSHPTDAAIDTYLGPLVSSPARRALTDAYAVTLERNSLLGVESSLKAAAVPTRIVWGMADTIFSPLGAEYLDRALGAASRGVRTLEGSRLFWPEEQPDVIAHEARRLWQAWSPQRAPR